MCENCKWWSDTLKNHPEELVQLVLELERRLDRLEDLE